MDYPTLTLRGLSNLEQAEIEQNFAPALVQFEPNKVGGRFGEPTVVTAIIILTVAALKAYIAYLVLKNKHTLTIDEELEITDISGNTIRRRVKCKASSPAELETKLLSSITKLADIKLD